MKDPEAAEVQSRRAAERRKRRSELLENEIKEKMLKIDEPGETIEDIPFSGEDGLGENFEQDGATDAEPANSEIQGESEGSLDRDQTTVDAGTRTVNSDFKVNTQTHAATQTDEFEYLFKETVVQPFTEQYFVNNEDRVRFYTGLPGFDVLNTTSCFVSPFISEDLALRFRLCQLFQGHLLHGSLLWENSFTEESNLFIRSTSNDIQ